MEMEQTMEQMVEQLLVDMKAGHKEMAAEMKGC
jgi:hypothetical protein